MENPCVQPFPELLLRLLFFVCSLFLISCFSFERKGERQCKSQQAIAKPSVHPFPKLYLRDVPYINCAAARDPQPAKAARGMAEEEMPEVPGTTARQSAESNVPVYAFQTIE
mmetsp:Transcript_86414/g.126457  ORF Transcript_86414/g.126457 Transcript_86414/m.126457 type:complete len:112 (-) Transcript_86414:155-490(-)